LGRFGEIWALAKHAKTETDAMATGITTRARDRNIKEPPTSRVRRKRALRFTDFL
jgi:hypothetical protein